MRPRLDAGEYKRAGNRDDAESLASMRPRLDAGEYSGDYLHPGHRGRASMRPRLDAGEYAWGVAAVKPEHIGFNEAPAGCRGIRAICFDVGARMVASMRPRLDAGEYRLAAEYTHQIATASMRPRLDAGEYRRAEPTIALGSGALQ